MVGTHLTADQRTHLRTQSRSAELAPRARDRIEMVLLSDAGWPAHRIATHLDYCALTVRKVLHAFLAAGEAAFALAKPGPAPDTTRRAQVTAALQGLLDQERTWTAAQLATALGEQGIALSTRQTRKYLQLVGARWQRTKRTLAHKQDPPRVARAARTLDAVKRGRQVENAGSGISMSVALAPASR